MTKYHIYCDESSLSDRYSCYGGIIVNNNYLSLVRDAITSLRDKHFLNTEIKWSKISNQYYNKYYNLICDISSLVNKDIIHFRSIVIDNHQVSHSRNNNGDKEKGMYKFYYLLLKHCFLKDISGECDIYIDKRSTNYNLDELRDFINRTQDINTYVTSVKHIDSKKSDLIQINDLLLGALAFHKNEKYSISGVRQSKIDIANTVASIIGGLETLGECTPRSQKRFKVWNINLK